MQSKSVQDPVNLSPLFISGIRSDFIPISPEILKQFIYDLKQNAADPTQISRVHLQIIKQQSFEQSFKAADIAFDNYYTPGLPRFMV